MATVGKLLKMVKLLKEASKPETVIAVEPGETPVASKEVIWNLTPAPDSAGLTSVNSAKVALRV